MAFSTTLGINELRSFLRSCLTEPISARTTMCVPAGRVLRCFWRECRSWRATLWRTTDPPTLLPIIKPAWAGVFVMVGLRYTTRNLLDTRKPLFVVRAKSFGEVSRAWRGSTRGTYADRRARPFARRAPRIARPARVAIRARKPCFFARRRTFGW